MSHEALLNSSGCPYAQLRGSGEESHEQAPMTRIVVGDRVKNQLDDERLVTVAEAEALIVERSPDARVTVHLGQGTDYECLRRLYSSGGGGGWVRPGMALVPAQLPAKASCQATHKQMESNILISQPRANGHGAYVAELLIDDRCADMSDHLTGEHVPGMAIAEAARQMIIAVTEEFFIAKMWSNKLRFVTHQMDVEYLDFLLPLAAELRYVPISLRRATDENMKFSCEVEFVQSGHVAAVARFTYSTINRCYLESLESAKLERALSAVCNVGEPSAITSDVRVDQ